MNKMICEGATTELTVVIITLAPNKGDKQSIENWRLISLLPCVTRLCSKVLTNWLKNLIGEILGETQHWGKKGQKVQHILAILRDLLPRREEQSENDLKQMLICVDFIKAFDSVVRDYLWKLMMDKYSFCSKFVEFYWNLFRHAVAKVVVNGSLTEELSLEIFLQYGDPSSSFLFQIHLDPLIKYIEARITDITVLLTVVLKSEAFMDDANFIVDGVILSELQFSSDSISKLEFADDLVLWSAGRDVNIIANNVNLALDELAAFSAAFSKPISKSKTNAIIFHNKKSIILDGVINFLFNYISDRSYKVRVQNELSSISESYLGLPQESILTPLLFLLVLSELQFNSDSTSKFEFANDLVLWSAGRDVNIIANNISLALEELADFSAAFSQPISKSKTNAIIFHNKKSVIPPKLFVNNVEIEHAVEPKLLRVYLDLRLTWQNQINCVKNPCMGRLLILKRLVGSKWATSQEILFNFYKRFSRSKIEHTFESYGE
ncbi:hypothetical protein QYM36_000743, partial [Artemia franciscana]